MMMAGISSRTEGKVENKKKYNGYEQQSKEFSDGSGLEWYDYKNRFYDNQIGRFFCVDRLASDYVHYTPYQFAGNEVPNAIDLDGLEPMYVIDSKNSQPDYRDPEVRGQAIKTIKGIVILAATALNPALGFTLYASDRTGIPIPLVPSPTSLVPTVVSETSTVVKAVKSDALVAENNVTIYRGVNSESPAYSNAKKGVAIPRGGSATPAAHNEGNTKSNFTSWSTNEEVAVNSALRPRGGSGEGVVLKASVPKDFVVASPNTKDINLIQTPGKRVSESEVLIKGVFYTPTVIHVKHN